MSGDGQLRAFIERILRLKEEQDSLAADIREIYAEAKGSGFDKTAMGQLVSHLRKIEKVGADAVEEGQTVFDLYLSAYQRATGTPLATHTHEASQSYAEAKDRGVDPNSTPPHNPETGELTDTQEQPEEPATQSPASEHKATGHAPRTTGSADANMEKGDVDGSASARPAGQTIGTQPEGVESGIDVEFIERNTSGPDDKRAPLSNPQPAASLGADTAGDVPPPSSPAALSDAEIPAFLRKEEKKDCLKLKDGHCKISFDTPALCSVCNAERMKARAA